MTASAAELLAEIARASTDGWSEARAIAAQAESLRDRARPLAELSTKAYEEALAATGGDYEVGRAYASAAEPPLEIVEAAADVAELAAYIAERAEFPPGARTGVTAGLVAAGCARARLPSSSP